MARQNLTPDEMLWAGRQWAVTPYGLETIGKPYHYRLAAGQLDDMRAARGVLDMPLHMMEKEWLDVDDFLTAYLAAIALHGLRIRPATLRASLKAAAVERRSCL